MTLDSVCVCVCVCARARVRPCVCFMSVSAFVFLFVFAFSSLVCLLFVCSCLLFLPRVGSRPSYVASRDE